MIRYCYLFYYWGVKLFKYNCLSLINKIAKHSTVEETKVLPHSFIKETFILIYKMCSLLEIERLKNKKQKIYHTTYPKQVYSYTPLGYYFNYGCKYVYVCLHIHTFIHMHTHATFIYFIPFPSIHKTK